MQIWTYENGDEKTHIFSRGSKNVKKTDEKRVKCKFTSRNCVWAAYLHAHNFFLNKSSRKLTLNISPGHFFSIKLQCFRVDLPTCETVQRLKNHTLNLLW